MANSFKETEIIIKNIDGWLSKRESEFLYKTAENCQGKGIIVEIGSYKGKSTICLAFGSKAGKNIKICAIDPHISDLEQKFHNKGKSTFTIFKKNIEKAGVKDIIFPIIRPSREVIKNWSEPIEFLWIDGDHSYQGAKTDFDLYSPFVMEGGIIAFHDSTQGDVNKVAFESFNKSGFVNLGIIDSVTFGHKFSNRSKTVKDKLILFLLSNYGNFRKIKILRSLKDAIKSAVSKI